jgi:hypothetical protein
VSAATLRLERVQSDFSTFPVVAEAGEVYGPQFPRLHMYSPFKHEGAYFDGYKPFLSSHSNEQGSSGSLNSASVLLLAFLLLVKLL